MHNPDLPGIDDVDGPPSAVHPLGYAVIELLIVAQDIDLWMKMLDLADEAIAVAKSRVDP